MLLLLLLLLLNPVIFNQLGMLFLLFTNLESEKSVLLIIYVLTTGFTQHWLMIRVQVTQKAIRSCRGKIISLIRQWQTSPPSKKLN